MRILLVSDTHGVLDPRIEALVAGVDLVVHAGDVGSTGVLDQLAPVQAVLGNNDTEAKWIGARRGLRGLRESREIDAPGGIIAVEHGHKVNPVARRHAKLRARHPQARLIVYGHSHRLVVDQDERPWVVNPGAAGRARTYGGPSCVVLTATRRSWSVAVERFEPG